MVYRRNYKAPVKKSPVRKMVKKVFKKRVVAPSIKAYVKRALHSNEENKTPTTNTQSYQSIIPMTNLTYGNIISCASIWNLNQGSGSGDRIGNKITPVKWNITGSLTTAGTATNPMIIKMYVFKLKNGFADPSASGGVPSDFFQLGSSTTAPAQNMTDTYRHVNSDKYQVYTTRTYKIGLASNAATFSNNDFKFLHMFNINLLKYQKHKISYNDSTAAPTNAGLYIAFTACDTDNSAIPADSIKITYDVSGRYEDA